MDGLRSEQRGVRFRRFVEQLEHASSLFAVEPDHCLAFEDFLSLAVGGLHHEVIERRTFEIGGGLDGFPNAGRDTSDQAGPLFAYGGHGAKMTPGFGMVKLGMSGQQSIRGQTSATS